MSDKPLVLLDVDGVINDIFGMGVRASTWTTDIVVSHGYKLAIPSYMPALVQDLCKVADVHWCTTWRHKANDEIAAHLGIGPLPVVDDGTDDRCTDWKASAAYSLVEEAIASERPVLWIEDFYGLVPSAVMPAGTQFLDTTKDVPGALLLRGRLPWWLKGLIELENTDPLYVPQRRRTR